jgi:hypothetical protein
MNGDWFGFASNWQNMRQLNFRCIMLQTTLFSEAQLPICFPVPMRTTDYILC